MKTIIKLSLCLLLSKFNYGQSVDLSGIYTLYGIPVDSVADFSQKFHFFKKDSFSFSQHSCPGPTAGSIEGKGVYDLSGNTLTLKFEKSKNTISKLLIEKIKSKNNTDKDSSVIRIITNEPYSSIVINLNSGERKFYCSQSGANTFNVAKNDFPINGQVSNLCHLAEDFTIEKPSDCKITIKMVSIIGDATINNGQIWKFKILSTDNGFSLVPYINFGADMANEPKHYLKM
ncbi:MAG: hypothetical protein QM727_04395 [Niabella sp.]